MSAIILGIESSCDDTSAAVIKDGYLLSNVVSSQAVHEAYGGVVPELASRAHQQNIVPVVHEALKRAGVTKEEVQAMYNRHLDEITKGDEQRLKDTQHLDSVIKETAHCLAEAMLIAKFIQGLPVVGVVGGFSNFTIMKDISEMAKVKYKKRYLKEKLIN